MSTSPSILGIVDPASSYAILGLRCKSSATYQLRGAPGLDLGLLRPGTGISP